LKNPLWVSWDLLPKISAVANLEPTGQNWFRRGADNYCEFYRPILSVGKPPLAGADLAQIDQSILTTNAAIQGKVMAAFRAAGLSSQIKFFDDYKYFQEIDFKNNQDNQSLRIKFPYPWRKDIDQYVDNRYISAFTVYLNPTQGNVVPSIKKVVTGGLQSLDGMHPTGTGYMLKAIALSNDPDLQMPNQVPDNEKQQFLVQAFSEPGSLTANFPAIVNSLRFFLSDLAPWSSQSSRTTGAPDNSGVATWLNILSASMAQPTASPGSRVSKKSAKRK
jgi:hypothetical protein